MGANPTTVLKTTTTKETSTTTIQDCDCGSEREYCNACADLRDNSSEFYTNGVTTNVCNSLSNDKGFNPESEHDDCDDLHLANDCLIETLIEKLPAYDVCDWKDYMEQLMPNIYNMNKAIISAICGLWCHTNFLFSGATFNIGEDTKGDAYAVAGKGVSFLNVSHGEHSLDIGLRYIAGGLAQGFGSYLFYNNDFTDSGSCGNFDLGTNYRESKARKGNPRWGTYGEYHHCGELICEFRIKRSKYPQIKHLFNGYGQETGGASYHVYIPVFYEGSYAFGQTGWCDSDGNPSTAGDDGGHLVPKGWIYVQVRMTSCYSWARTDGIQYTPIYFMGMRTNQDQIGC